MSDPNFSPCQLMNYCALQRKVLSGAKESKPQLMVVIDTEEEFDWGAQPDATQRGVTAIDHIDRVQSIFDEYGIVPCYVIDHPVASEPVAFNRLRSIMEEGRCEIGAHLHPWVNPPLANGPVSRADMYPGNLSPEDERSKLEQLTEVITNNLGIKPHIYKAGRYGFGPNTQQILQALDYDIDLSFCPPLDSRADGGPNYEHCVAQPFWLPNSKILEIPVTGAFTGVFGQFSPAIYRLATILRPLKAPAILSRLGLLDRLTLSPEGFCSEEHIRLTRFLYKAGVRVFTWSFHSTSVKPGCAPYVNTEEDLRYFLATFTRYFEYFFGELGGVATTPSKIRRQMESIR